VYKLKSLEVWKTAYAFNLLSEQEATELSDLSQQTIRLLVGLLRGLKARTP
jgi:hypothetical protein